MRFNNLTVARFISAVLVFVHHSPGIANVSKSQMFNTFAVNGFVGVSFFFILSGFVLSAASLHSLRTFEFRKIGAFYWKRMARIVPLWLVVSSPLIFGAIGRHDPAIVPFLTFTQAWYSDMTLAFSILPVAWTLSVEVFFYLVFPIIALIVGPLRSSTTGPIMVAVGLSISGIGAAFYALRPELATLGWDDPAGPHRWLYRFPGARLGEFIAGIGIYLTISRKAPSPGLFRAWALFAASVFSLIFVMGHLPIGRAWFVFPYAVLFSFLILRLARLEQLGANVMSPTLLLLGEASFAFYLIHQSYVLRLYGNLVSTSGSVPVTIVFLLIVAVALSVGLFMLIETPARVALIKLLHIRSTQPEVVPRSEAVRY